MKGPLEFMGFVFESRLGDLAPVETLRRSFGFLLMLFLMSGAGCVDSGVSELIERIEVDRMPYETAPGPLADGKICSGDVVRVKVVPKLPAITQVDIDGYPGEVRYLHYRGLAESTDIVVTASVFGRGRDVVRETIEIEDCVTPDVPTLRVQPSLYSPYAVDFTVVNHASLTGWQEFNWTFGDGESQVTYVPYVQHSYEASTDGQRPYESFEVTLANAPAEVPGRLVRHHRISVLDPTRIALEKGIVQLRAWATGPLDVVNNKRAAGFFIRNTREEPLVLTHLMESQQPCADLSSPILTSRPVADVLFQGGYDDYDDPQGADEDTLYYQEALVYANALQNLPANSFVVRPSDAVLQEVGQSGGVSPPLPTLDTSIVGSVVIPHESVHAGSFVFEISDYASDICVLGYHFTGITGSGLPVEADLYYELRPDPAETQTVTDGDFVSFLNQLVSEGLVADPSRVTTQELFQLQQSGKIRRLGEGWEIVTP